MGRQRKVSPRTSSLTTPRNDRRTAPAACRRETTGRLTVARWDSRLKIASLSAGRTPSQVHDASHTEVSGHFPQPGPARGEESVEQPTVPELQSRLQSNRRLQGHREDCTRGEPAIFATFVQFSCAAAINRDHSLRPRQSPGRDEPCLSAVDSRPKSLVPTVSSTHSNLTRRPD